jgi:DNA repair protein RadC
LADKQLTERLQQALMLIDVRLLDHIVIAGHVCYSFAEHGDL